MFLEARFVPIDLSSEDCEILLVCNRTNAEVIAEAYGHDTEDWVGKPILLYPAKTQFKGQMTPCIRVRIQQGQPAPQHQQPQRRPKSPQPDGEQAPPADHRG